MNKVGWKYIFTIENTGIDNGYGHQGTLLTYGDTYEELITNAGLLFYDNDGAIPRTGPAELNYKELYEKDKQTVESLIKDEMAYTHLRAQ